MHIIADLLSVTKDGSAGGATGFAIGLINSMLERNEVAVTVVCRPESKDFLRKKLEKRARIKSVRSCKVFGTAFALKRAGNILFCPFGSIDFYNKKIPTVSCILDIQHEFYPQFFSEQELVHRRKFYGRIVEKADAVACISDYTRKTFCGKYGYPPENAYTIYIPVPRYENKPSDILERLGLKKERFFLYTANFWKHKNHIRLLEAYGRFAEEYGDIYKLVLTGNSLNNRSVEEKIKEMRLSDRVVITGYIGDGDIKQLMDNAKGVVFPSLFEGFGIPVIEAMDAGRLIACSNATCLPEIGAEAIHYFNPEDIGEMEESLRYLAENRMNAEIMESYRKKLSLYDRTRITDQYLRLFEYVMQSRRDYEKRK